MQARAVARREGGQAAVAGARGGGVGWVVSVIRARRVGRDLAGRRRKTESAKTVRARRAARA